ncbi:hypothetical protein GBK04_00300 [Cytophagaceae bacterium SJW1-29]|uniref:Uncharacterized protein n=1 Tax=Salmonirosea aquatica TaxID=2654236 RepID=A0A7C9FAM2_9BACT|nr:hypothetical protein [Cytophagaceae bacterium SJW1-29]
MDSLQGKELGFDVTVLPDTLLVDFTEIRQEIIERYGYAEKPADEPWIIGKLSREDFFRMKEEESEESENDEKL